MLTSAVKHVSGPLQPRKSEPKGLVVFNSFTRHSQGQPGKSPGRAMLFCACALLSFVTASLANAQTLHARISVVSVAPARIRIEAEFPNATNSLSFRNSYAGVLGLGDRIEALQAINAGGENIRVQKLAPGEFQTAEKFTHFIYEVNLAEPSRPAQMSHVSWVNQQHGLLMLADLLPQSTGSYSSILISFDVPTGWTVASNTKTKARGFQLTIRRTPCF